jgi:tetratricopeptide (TPR) repeat protein
MLFKLTAAAALGLTLFAPDMAAQTVAEQLQKAIYAQETAGNLDEAIAIYRRIIGSAQASRQVAATAQFRLAQSLLQKGDLAAAGREFEALSISYPDQRELVAGLASRLGPGRRNLTKGIIQNGRYIHGATGVQLVTTPELQVETDSESSDGGEMVVLMRRGELGVAVWLKPEDQEASNLAASVRQDLEKKPSQRPPGWRVRPESIRTGGGADRQWLSAVADFNQQGVKLVELVTWYRTTKVHAFFFGTMPESFLPKNQDRFAQIVSTAVIP